MYFFLSMQINNAGINKGFKPLVQFTDEEINQVTSCTYFRAVIPATAFFLNFFSCFYLLLLVICSV